jgi:hypothetical protein
MGLVIWDIGRARYGVIDVEMKETSNEELKFVLCLQVSTATRHQSK